MKTDQLTFFSKRNFSILIACFAFLYSTSTFAATIAYLGTGGTTTWENPANWTGGLVPGAGDIATISGGFTVTLSSAVSASGLVLNTSAAGAPKLTIAAAGNLTIVNALSSYSALSLQGGNLINNGTISITASGTTVGMQLINGTGTFVSASQYSGTGALTINTAANCINFSQSNEVASFSVGGAITLTPAANAYAFSITGGSSKITGTGSISIGSVATPVNYGLLSINGSAGTSPTLTIDNNVILNAYSTGLGQFVGTLFMSNLTSNSLINNGTLNIGGGGYNGIYTAAGATFTNTLTNAGTINLTGAYTQSAIRNGGTGTVSINNTGNLSVDYLATNGSCIGQGSTAATVSIINSGTMTFGSHGTNATAILLGDSKTSFANTGTLINNKGVISGTTGGTGVAAFNNNTGGLANLNVGISNTAIGSYILFTNNGGTLTGSGNVTNGSFASSTGTLSPGGADCGIFNFYLASSATFTLTGKCLISVKGKTTSGTDHDLISVAATAANLDISGAALQVSIGYTPQVHDTVAVITAPKAIIGTFTSVTIPRGWSVLYNANSVKLVCDSVVLSTAVDKLDNASQLVYGIQNAIVLKQCVGKRISILNTAGQLVKECILNSEDELLPMKKGFYIVKGDDFTRKVVVK